MAKKRKEKTSERNSLLSKEQEKKLQSMVTDMLDIAASVVDEYESMDMDLDLDLSELSELSGSLENIIQVHESSPFLDEIFKGDQWKKVIKNIPSMPKTNPDKDDSE